MSENVQQKLQCKSFSLLLYKQKVHVAVCQNHLTSTSKVGQGNKSKDVPRNQDVHDQVE